MRPSSMSDAPAACRLCGATRIEPLGVIPDSDYFAGKVLAQALDGGGLWRCTSCRSMFRHPILAPADYLRLYAEAPAEAWSAGHGRLDLEIIYRLIQRRSPAPSVLDVGCGSGGFLSSLPAGVKKFGIEPSTAAAQAARGLGVAILGATPADLALEAQFDVITIIDVIEHLAEPTRTLDQLLPHLAPGGCLILSTGDPASPPWQRYFRSRFWYSCFPEHITFPSAQYFRGWQQARGLLVPEVVATRYRKLPAWHWALSFVEQVVYALSPTCIDWLGRCAEALLRRAPPRRRTRSPGSAGVFTDHQVVMIQRPSAAVIRSPAS